MPHPNSRYARVVVWAVVAIWLETYCWLVANTYWLCLAMPGDTGRLFGRWWKMGGRKCRVCLKAEFTGNVDVV
jgi:hypothetical protein